MRAGRPFQIAVEPASAGVAGVRVAGDLTAETGLLLLRLLDDVVGRATERGGITHVLVDLANVRSFEASGVRLLRHARVSGARAGMQLLVAGVDGHREALPDTVAAALAEFPMVLSIDDPGLLQVTR